MELNGYAVKAVKMMETPRGISFTGNIYFDGKMIGDAYNSGEGGMTNVSLRPEHRDHYSVLDDEDFVERLFTLNDHETMFKKVIKGENVKGMAVVTYDNPFDIDYIVCINVETPESITEKLNKSQPEREIESVEVFRSLDDFIVKDASHAPSHEKARERSGGKESVIKTIRDAKKTPAPRKEASTRKKQGPEL